MVDLFGCKGTENQAEDQINSCLFILFSTSCRSGLLVILNTDASAAWHRSTALLSSCIARFSFENSQN
jgi:hypothetical protein